MNIRRLIIKRIKANGGNGLWLLDIYHYLIERGVSPEEAMLAISAFVYEGLPLFVVFACFVYGLVIKMDGII